MSDPSTYTEAILGKPNEEYVQWISKPDKWGGDFYPHSQAESVSIRGFGVWRLVHHHCKLSEAKLSCRSNKNLKQHRTFMNDVIIITLFSYFSSNMCHSVLLRNR